MRPARKHQLSFSAQNLWLLRMEAGDAARHADGSVQPLFLPDHQTVSGNRAGRTGSGVFADKFIIFFKKGLSI